MQYYNEKKILFIHIPKTGGTVIETRIKKNTNQSLFSDRGNQILPKPYNRVSLQHQIYTTIYQHRDILGINFDNIKIFTVVRNPYDRIISDLFWYRLIKKNFTPEQVFNVIKNKYLNRTDLDNHNIPQFKFITNEKYKNIKI